MKTQMENYKNFLGDSYLDDIHMEDNNVVMKKKYADKLVFEFIDVGLQKHKYDNLKSRFRLKLQK